MHHRVTHRIEIERGHDSRQRMHLHHQIILPVESVAVNFSVLLEVLRIVLRRCQAFRPRSLWAMALAGCCSLSAGLCDGGGGVSRVHLNRETTEPRSRQRCCSIMPVVKLVPVDSLWIRRRAQRKLPVCLREYSAASLAVSAAHVSIEALDRREKSVSGKISLVFGGAFLSVDCSTKVLAGVQ